jgi:hypothetical protein
MLKHLQYRHLQQRHLKECLGILLDQISQLTSICTKNSVMKVSFFHLLANS